MTLLPIKPTLPENQEFATHPMCNEVLLMTLQYYLRIGYTAPWIGYFAVEKGELVGSAGFKGKPVDGKVEIAYGTFEPYQRQGVGTAICRQMVLLALQADPTLVITARTLTNNGYSARILEKNNFVCAGIVSDPEDGDVWEWVYKGKND